MPVWSVKMGNYPNHLLESLYFNWAWSWRCDSSFGSFGLTMLGCCKVIQKWIALSVMTGVITQTSLNFRSESNSGFMVALTHTAPPPGSQKLWHVSVFIEWPRCWWNISRQQAQVSVRLTLRARVWRSPQENTRQSARAVLWWFQGVSAATPSNHCGSSPKHSGFPFSIFF